MALISKSIEYQARQKQRDKAPTPKPGIPLQKSEIERLLKHYNGNISKVADKLGCNRHTIHNRINNDPDLRLVCEEARERIVDSLEQCARERALDGDTTMMIFLLRTIGKHRGYDQDMNHVQNLANAAFEFVINKSKSPVDQQSPAHLVVETTPVSQPYLEHYKSSN